MISATNLSAVYADNYETKRDFCAETTVFRRVSWNVSTVRRWTSLPWSFRFFLDTSKYINGNVKFPQDRQRSFSFLSRTFIDPIYERQTQGSPWFRTRIFAHISAYSDSSGSLWAAYDTNGELALHSLIYSVDFLVDCLSRTPSQQLVCARSFDHVANEFLERKRKRRWRKRERELSWRRFRSSRLTYQSFPEDEKFTVSRVPADRRRTNTIV